MKENVLICKCKQVYYADIEKALHDHSRFEDVQKEFAHLQAITNCSTGCGGCHDEIMQIISEIIN